LVCFSIVSQSILALALSCLEGARVPLFNAESAIINITDVSSEGGVWDSKKGRKK